MKTAILLIITSLFSLNCFSKNDDEFNIVVIYASDGVCIKAPDNCIGVEPGEQLLGSDLVRVVDDQAFYYEYKHPKTHRLISGGLSAIPGREYQPILGFAIAKSGNKSSTIFGGGTVVGGSSRVTGGSFATKSVFGGASRSDAAECWIMSEFRLPANWNKSIVLNAFHCDLDKKDVAMLTIREQDKKSRKDIQKNNKDWVINTKDLKPGKYTLLFTLNDKPIHEAAMILTDKAEFFKEMKFAVNTLPRESVETVNNIAAAYVNNYLALAVHYAHWAEQRGIDTKKWGAKAISAMETTAIRPNLIVEVE